MSTNRAAEIERQIISRTAATDTSAVTTDRAGKPTSEHEAPAPKYRFPANPPRRPQQLRKRFR